MGKYALLLSIMVFNALMLVLFGFYGEMTGVEPTQQAIDEYIDTVDLGFLQLIFLTVASFLINIFGSFVGSIFIGLAFMPVWVTLIVFAPLNFLFFYIVIRGVIPTLND